jgi:dephospho-CoA kinase
VAAHPWSDWAVACSGAGLLVNTTSLGMTGKDALTADLTCLPSTAAVADIVYHPLETPLLREAAAQGRRTMDGLGMLMHQAVPAFAAWYGITPQVTPALRAKLTDALTHALQAGRKRVFVVGLTGSIGMGKSETAALFARLGIPVHDSDAAVHALYAQGGGAVAAIAHAFPGTVAGGAVDRAALARALKDDAAAFGRLEAIVHPLVAKARGDFLARAAERGERLVVVDIPLLYESGAQRDVDAVVVVSAPAQTQRARVLARPGMTAEKFEALHARQMPDAEKRAKADFVIETDKGLEHAFERVKAVADALRRRAESED